MQPDEGHSSQDWQQPVEAASRPPYGVSDGQETQTETGSGAVQSVPEQPSPRSSIEEATSPEPVVSAEPSEDDAALIRWEAAEYIHHNRGALWYVIATFIIIALMAVAIFLLHSVTFAILIPVMAVALVIYVRRPPERLRYVLSHKGIHINDKIFIYDEFKSFGVIGHANTHSVVLIPRKRFQISQIIYFPEEIGEQLVDMLAERLPMKEVQLDALDRFLARIRL